MSFLSSSVCNTSQNLWKRNLLMFFVVAALCFMSLEGVCSYDLIGKQVFSDKLWSREEMVEMAGYGEEKLSSVSVTGSVFCHSCSPDDHTPHSSPIQGALIGVKCKTKDKRRSSWTRAVTDESGEFVADLPSHLHASPNLEKTCLVKVLHIPKGSKCQPPHPKKHRGIKLSHSRNGIRTYTTGLIEFQQFTHRSSKSCINKSSI